MSKIADLARRRVVELRSGHGRGPSSAREAALNGAGRAGLADPLTDRSVIPHMDLRLADRSIRRANGGGDSNAYTTRMKCSARCSPVPAPSPISAPAGCKTRPIPSLIRRWGRSSPRPSTSSPMPRRRAASPNSASTASIVEGKTVAVTEEIVLRKPFGQLKHFRKRGRRRRAQAADRRADVGPLCDPAARHGRADAAGPRRLHHRLARREAGAARRRPLRSRRLYRLSDRLPRAYRPRRAHARGLPALGARLMPPRR